MADLNEENIKILSRLCRIEMKEEETHQLLISLRRIIGYIDQLKEVNANDLVPYSHLDHQGIESLRPDVVDSILPRKTFLSNTPNHVGGMVRVPPIIKQPS